jgi:nitroreductase
MDTFEAVRTVLAVRAYQNKPVPPETIRRIVEAGHLTASASNKQPWHFIVVEKRETLSQLGALLRTGPYVAQAAFAVVVAVEDTPFGISDGSRAIQSMILTAWSEGVGSNWAGWLGMPKVNALLGIPEQMQVLSVLPFGYPAKAVGKGKKNRKPLAEVARRERFDKPFE